VDWTALIRDLRRVSLVAGVVLGIVWLVWRGPHLVDDVRYSLATPWPGIELTLAEDSTVEVGGRRVTVTAGMGVDCMPGVKPLPIPTPPCRGPGMSARLQAKGVVGQPELPLLVHARVESEGTVWETDLHEIERERYYDSTFNNQYAGAAAQREPPRWEGGRVIRVTVWLKHDGRLYRVTLPPAPIMIAI
jgi:hypothetical protein